MFWEYNRKIENLIENIDNCIERINMFTENAVFTGKTGDAVKSYLGEAHITILSGIKVTAQTLLDNMAAYKDGYRAIDSSTNFKLDEEAIQEFRKKLASNYEDTDEYTDKIRSALSEVSDISDVGMPDINGVFDIHEQMDSDLIKLVSNVNSYERENVVRLENSVELLLENLQSCLSKIGLSQCAIESYETGSFITGKAADAIEGTQDIYYGSTGDIDSTAVNGIKDDLFRGNEDAYYLTENAFAFAASAMIPIGRASTAGNLTFKRTATIVVKEGISMGAGAGAQKITTDVTGNDTAGMVAGMVASGVTAKGLNGIEAEANKLAKAPKGLDGVTEEAGNLAEDVGKAGKGLEGAANGAESAVEDVGKVVESGSSSGKVWDYSKQFDGELANFNAGYEIKNVIKEDLYLVQFHSNAEVGSGRSLKYWTTFDAANRISTVDDYMNQMALLSNWGARDNVSIAKIPAGTKIKYAIGTAKEQVGAIESRPGGGLQILFEKFDDGWVLDTRPLP